ncbi:unnamed protein product [Symbiodinium microadriaticum]|nr:unnamed protein product [Symbiodinium microadriaticum]
MVNGLPFLDSQLEPSLAGKALICDLTAERTHTMPVHLPGIGPMIQSGIPSGIEAHIEQTSAATVIGVTVPGIRAAAEVLRSSRGVTGASVEYRAALFKTPDNLEEVAAEASRFLPQSLVQVTRPFDTKKEMLPEGSSLDAFDNLYAIELPYIGASLTSFEAMSDFMLEKGLGPPFYTRGPYKGQPVLIRVIPQKSRIGLMTAGRRLSDAVTEERTKAAYDASRQARAVSCALLGGFTKTREARGLKSLWSLASSASATSTVSSLLIDIEGLIGSLLTSNIEESGKVEIGKLTRHRAIAAFTKSFSTKAFLAVYGIDLKETNVPESFLSYYDKSIGEGKAQVSLRVGLEEEVDQDGVATQLVPASDPAVPSSGLTAGQEDGGPPAASEGIDMSTLQQLAQAPVLNKEAILAEYGAGVLEMVQVQRALATTETQMDMSSSGANASGS